MKYITVLPNNAKYNFLDISEIAFLNNILNIPKLSFMKNVIKKDKQQQNLTDFLMGCKKDGKGT